MLIQNKSKVSHTISLGSFIEGLHACNGIRPMRIYVCACVLSHFSCVWLCNPMDRSPPGSSVHGISQARILEWVAMPFSRGSSQPRDQTQVSYISCIDRWVPYHKCHLGSPNLCLRVLVAQLCPTICDPMDCSPSGSSVQRILQARILEWVAIPFSRKKELWSGSKSASI